MMQQRQPISLEMLAVGNLTLCDVERMMKIPGLEKKYGDLLRQSTSGYNFLQCHPELRNLRLFVSLAVSEDGAALEYASAELRNDREIVRLAVSQNGYALEYASPELRNDREIVRVAVSQDGWALDYASPELRNDREIVRVAVSQKGRALEYANDEIRNDREIVRLAVSKCGYALKYASEELLNDREIVRLAVSEDGAALEYASLELRNDREIVRLAVTKCGYALKYASLGLRNDREIVRVAVSEDGYALEYASLELRNDREIVRLVRDNRVRFDIILRNPVIELYFGDQATSSGAERANYTSEIDYTGNEPLYNVQLLYDNNINSVPDETGYHLWSYALDSESLNPCGSTNFTKLATTTLRSCPLFSKPNQSPSIRSFVGFPTL